MGGLGAAEQLAHIDRSMRLMVTERITKEFCLQKYGKNVAEGLLCETSTTRLGTIFDYFIKGQPLFCLSPEGVPMVKEYGSEDWVEVG